MCMDALKLFEKDERKLVTLMQTVRIYSQDIGVEFGKEIFAMLVIKSSERDTTERIELPNQEKSEQSEKRKPINTLE